MWLWANLAEWLTDTVKPTRCFIVTDARVAQVHLGVLEQTLMGAGLDVRSTVVPSGEASKSLRHASQLFDWLVEQRADRHSIVLALGGGVVGDLAGFVAATFARGLRFVQLPTTLLAMVDASVGGKVAVDHPRGKNLIGAFHQPQGVFADLSMLETLGNREFTSGMAEVVKYGVILDAMLFEYQELNFQQIQARNPAVLEHLVVESCRLKAIVVEEDEHETTGRRAILNFGHTFAHAFETAGHYADLLHGEAVAIGMVCAAELARRLGRIDSDLTFRLHQLLANLGLPTRVPRAIASEPLVELMRSDKKTVGGKLRFILPSRLGEVETVTGVDEALVADVIDDCTDRMSDFS